MHWRGSIGWVVLACVAVCGCEPDATAEAPGKPAQSARVDQEDGSTNSVPGGLVLGEYRLAPHTVVDGDTIRVEELDDSIRLLSVDTEEKVRSKRDRAAIAADFKGYIKAKRGDAVRPQKAGTPMGDQATEFAEAFFEGTETVRLERDDPKAIRGYFGRFLAYAFVQKDGKWISYNVEAVRAGMSPYFTKYGYSHRFHNQFARAEGEARSARRGIWNPEAKGYGDYAERKDWWDARADFIQAFEHEAAGHDDFVVLTYRDANARLEANLGKEVTVLGTVGKVQFFKGLVRVFLSVQRGHDFPIIFLDRAVFRDSEIGRYRGEPVRVRGAIERYKRGDYETLQIKVSDPKRVALPALPWPDDAARAAE